MEWNRAKVRPVWLQRKRERPCYEYSNHDHDSFFSLFFEPDEFYIASEQLEKESKGGIAVLRGWEVTKLDAEKKIAFLDDGTEIQYDKCLLATGIHPKNLPVFEDGSEQLKEKVPTKVSPSLIFHLCENSI